MAFKQAKQNTNGTAPDYWRIAAHGVDPDRRIAHGTLQGYLSESVRRAEEPVNDPLETYQVVVQGEAYDKYMADGVLASKSTNPRSQFYAYLRENPAPWQGMTPPMGPAGQASDPAVPFFATAEVV